MYGLIRWLLTVVVLAGIIAFALVNREVVTIKWFPAFTEVDLPVTLLVLIVFAAGFVVGGLLVWIDAAPRRRELRELRRYKKQQEKLAAEAKNPVTLPPELADVSAPDLLRY